jgi:hypothetical protein
MCHVSHVLSAVHISFTLMTKLRYVAKFAIT